MFDPRMAKLARLLVEYCTAVKRDDLVLIRGTTAAEPLVNEVCRAVVAAGGRPHVRLAPEETEAIYIRDAKPAQLKRVNPIQLFEARVIDCMIAMLGGRNTRFLSDVDPHKQAVYTKSRHPIQELMLKRAAEGRNPLRWVGTQAPTHSAAQDADMPTQAYEDFIYRAAFVDRPDPVAAWKKLGVAQQRLCDHLERCRELRFRNEQGTDLRVGILHRRWVNCAGRSNMPDGEVFTGPIETATEGVVCYGFPAVYGGREVTDIRLKFCAGRVVEASAGKNEKFLTEMLDQDPGARVLGEIAIGTNYHITRHMKNVLFDEKIGGTFHAALGAAYPETGGRNRSGLHWDMVCDMRQGGVIEADGKVISRNGRFVKAAWPQP